jgi:hypothetical protein
MLYNTPIKGDDGLYFVKALNDSKRKCLIQLNGVKLVDVSGDIVMDLTSDANVAKIQDIDTGNLSAAVENAETWFGKNLSDKVVEGAYTSSVADSQVTGERIDVTKVFNSDQEEVDFETIQPGKTCDVILEFSGLWFAKKSFGSSWNVVQVRVHPDPILDTYPEGFAFVDDEQ